MVVYDIVQAVRDHTWSIEHALDALEACVVPDPRISRIEAIANDAGYAGLPSNIVAQLKAILRGDQ